ncbi:ECF-type sigma factor [Aquimonas sp.]|jgi:RNA polymerase sigma factor (TIGR02999 family)|uniref:ECF-type sigma factor n=1 Tax=Aquimonas sp. TaxID=1872588 RepID=UPI0037C04F46
MELPPDREITLLLARWRQGDAEAGDQLISALYPTLKRIAQQNVRRFQGALTLRATELVHEMFERLQPQSSVEWENREHLIAIATTLMRRSAVDYLRGRNADKRGGGQAPRPLDLLPEHEHPLVEDCVGSLDLERALSELAEGHPAIAAVAELKLFSGLGKEDIASCCGISSATVSRHWRFARAWLADRLGDGLEADVSAAGA